jgi:class 3 adenylate cyclase
MPRFKVAHVKLQGVDIVLVPVSPEFSVLSSADQSAAHRQLSQLCRSARLGGEVTPVWSTGPSSLAFLADAKFHPLLNGRLTPAFLQANLNREITALQVGAQAARVILDPDAPAQQPSALGSGSSGAAAEAQQNHVSTADRAPAVDSGKPAAPMERANRKRYPMRVVTMLFTDVVHSTKLKQDYGDTRGMELLRRHHELVRRLLAQTSTGEEVSTAGDSFFISFGTPSEAVRFALQLQAKLRQNAELDGIRIMDRIGIHVGEVFAEDATANKAFDFHGIQVDSCARIMSLGHGDQILMSRFAFDNARQILRGQLIPGVTNLSWMSHGAYELKGVEEPIEICEVGETGRAYLQPPVDSTSGKRLMHGR